jgi:hypothetical protein
MSVQVIEFLSLTAVFMCGVMIVPVRAKISSSQEFPKYRKEFNSCSPSIPLVTFLLGKARVVSRWYFLLPERIYLQLILLLSKCLDNSSISWR